MKTKVFLVILLSLSLVFSSCKKEEPVAPPPVDDRPELSFKYRVSDENITQIFVADVAYTDANGDTVEVSKVTMPWEITQTVKLPYTANIMIKRYHLKTGVSIPDQIKVGRHLSIIGLGLDVETKTSAGTMTIQKADLDRYLEQSSSYTFSHTFLPKDTTAGE